MTWAAAQNTSDAAQAQLGGESKGAKVLGGMWAGEGLVGTTLTILANEVVTGRDREELGLTSRPSSSCPLPVLIQTKQERQKGKGDRGLRVPAALSPGLTCLGGSTSCLP